MFPPGSVELVLHMHQCIHLCHCSVMPNSVLWGTCASACGRGLRSSAFHVVCSCTSASACREPALVSLRSQWSYSMLSTCTWISRVCCSAILHLSVVSGLFPPTFPFYLLIYTISVPQMPLFSSAWGLLAGLPGLASHRSWLPIVEAPGCLEHSTSI